MPFANAGPPLLEFSRSEVVQTFRVINDNVMGGVSTSRRHSTNDALVFEGEVSLDRNGGFASLRGPISFPAESAALLLKVRGDGQRYKVTLKLDDSPGTGQYQADFVAHREWQTLRFMPADFTFSFRGRATAAPIVRFVAVRYFGLLIADRQAHTVFTLVSRVTLYPKQISIKVDIAALKKLIRELVQIRGVDSIDSEKPGKTRPKPS